MKCEPGYLGTAFQGEFRVMKRAFSKSLLVFPEPEFDILDALWIEFENKDGKINEASCDIEKGVREYLLPEECKKFLKAWIKI